MKIHTKRIYDPPSPEDGVRILVDRLWPRGVAKPAAKIDRWMKEVAPSTELRQWFHHEPRKWSDFEQRYRAELADNPALEVLREIAKSEPVVTLLFAAKDVEHNHALVLVEVLAKRKRSRRGG
jgi:uncharacterized protein YeaO (DUF488 family)